MTLTQKINRLYQLLIRDKKIFEQVAGQIKDNALRCTILSLAQQSNQYAAELFSLMESARTPVKLTDQPVNNTNNILPDENRVLAFCNSSERKLVMAYRKILKESVLYTGLQKMMGYQLDGLLAASMQLKLLNSLQQRRTH